MRISPHLKAAPHNLGYANPFAIIIARNHPGCKTVCRNKWRQNGPPFLQCQSIPTFIDRALSPYTLFLVSISPQCAYLHFLLWLV